MAEATSQHEQVTGTLGRVIFSAQDSYFKILSIEVEDTNIDGWNEPEMIVTGSFADVQEGGNYTFYGRLVNHPKYGQQLKVDHYQNELPSGRDGLVKYLSSDQFKGVGAKTAAKIVDHLGEEALDLIVADPTVLRGIVKPDIAKNIAQTLQSNLGLEQLFVQAGRLGISNELAGRLYDQYGSEAQDIISQHPYRLVFEFDGLSFRKVDQLAQRLNLAGDSPQRYQAAVYAALAAAGQHYGHTYLSQTQLVSAVAQLLGSSDLNLDQIVDDAQQALVKDDLVVVADGHSYTRPLYQDESEVAARLLALKNSQSQLKFTPKQIAKNLVVPKDIQLDQRQVEAVEQGLAAHVFVLTGGPGTGKTTIIQAIVATYERLLDRMAEEHDEPEQWRFDHRVRLASPTGRAAKRMTEVTGYEATTIHRLLGMVDFKQPEFNADQPLSGGLLIVDEASMLDIELADKLLAAVPDDMRIIFVGDSDQLPSVGPGNVLADLLASHQIDLSQLDVIYRQGRGSSINSLAASIKAGQLPDDFEENKGDRSTFLVSSDQAPQAVGQVLQAAIKKGFTAQDVQILTPMYKGSSGVVALNQLAQECFNPSRPGQKSLQRGQFVFRKGDKVLQLENDSERDIYNGDMGTVLAVHYQKDPGQQADGLVVDFDGKEATYDKKDLGQLTLAYATTVHKAQGNEFKLVLLVLADQFHMMLNRNLLYTGLTRAKEALILVGSRAAFERAAQTPVPPRQTALAQCLQDGKAGVKESVSQAKTAGTNTAKSNQSTILAATPSRSNPATSQPDAAAKHELTVAAIQDQSIDPMIGMGDLKPADFMPKKV
ncbi:ATP-dependent RecD-like DNA helicase [Lactobacillaceae bacterium L1_55_11]|nr:ATP-dependent RecD-like DNA helicase [Lactobacillaceae bacterium L1_55_11]